MLLLCFINPASLEAILPPFHSMDNNLDHLHELRRVWWALIATFVSTVDGYHVMFWHVRSSAPSAFWPLSREEQRHRPSLYYTLRTGSMNGMEHHLFLDDHDLVHAMNDFLGEITG